MTDRRFEKKLFIGISIVLVGIILISIPVWLEAGFRRELAMIRASGDPISITELEPLDVPDGDNLAYQLKDSYPRWRLLYEELFTWTANHSPLNWAKIRDDQVTSLEAIVDSHQGEIEALLLAMQANGYGSVEDISLPAPSFSEHYTRSREASLVLDSAARLALLKEQTDRAYALILAQFKLSRLSTNEPFFEPWLTAAYIHRQACETATMLLQTTQLSSVQRKDLTDQALIGDLKQSYRRCLKTERAVSVSFFEAFVARAPASRLTAMVFARDQARSLHLFRCFLDMLDGKETTLPEAPESSVLKETLESLERGRLAYQQTEERMAAFRILLRIDELGLKDESNLELADLKLPPEQTRSPITGRRFRLERDTTGWQVVASEEQSGQS